MKLLVATTALLAALTGAPSLAQPAAVQPATGGPGLQVQSTPEAAARKGKKRSPSKPGKRKPAKKAVPAR